MPFDSAIAKTMRITNLVRIIVGSRETWANQTGAVTDSGKEWRSATGGVKALVSGTMFTDASRRSDEYLAKGR